MHNKHWIHAAIAGLALAAAVPLTTAVAQENEKDPRPAPPRAEGEGPFELPEAAEQAALGVAIVALAQQRRRFR